MSHFTVLQMFNLSREANVSLSSRPSHIFKPYLKAYVFASILWNPFGTFKLIRFSSMPVYIHLSREWSGSFSRACLGSVNTAVVLDVVVHSSGPYQSADSMLIVYFPNILRLVNNKMVCSMEPVKCLQTHQQSSCSQDCFYTLKK